MYIILHNPLSKNRKSRIATKKVVDAFKKRNISFRLKSLLKIHDLASYIDKHKKDTRIVLIGGDGTVNTFINHTFKLAIDHEIRLKGSGSGNDFLRSLKRLSPEKQAIMKVRFNDKERYFINGSGIGIDGMVAHMVNQSSRKGKINYFTNTLKAFLKYKPTELNLNIDGASYNFKKCYLLNVNSGQFIGGGMRVTPGADPEKEELDVLVVHRIPKFMLFVIFLSVYLGMHMWFKRYVFHKKAKSVKATFVVPQYAQCDGETTEDIVSFAVNTTGKFTRFRAFDIKNT